MRFPARISTPCSLTSADGSSPRSRARFSLTFTSRGAATGVGSSRANKCLSAVRTSFRSRNGRCGRWCRGCLAKRSRDYQVNSQSIGCAQVVFGAGSSTGDRSCTAASIGVNDSVRDLAFVGFARRPSWTNSEKDAPPLCRRKTDSLATILTSDRNGASHRNSLPDSLGGCTLEIVDNFYSSPPAF